jgi:hypothetical protein
MDFTAGVLSVWGLLPSCEPILPLLHTGMRVYSILIPTGKGGGGGELTREKVRGAIVYKA